MYTITYKDIIVNITGDFNPKFVDAVIRRSIQKIEQCWMENNQLHRTDGPAILYADGGEEWYQNDELHNPNGPAVIFPGGSDENFQPKKEWWIHNERHRTDGPAVIHFDGSIEYWEQNDQVPVPEDWWQNIIEQSPHSAQIKFYLNTILQNIEDQLNLLQSQ